MTEKTQKEYREELFKLMRENPDLPVVPMVHQDCTEYEDFGWYLCSWGSAEIDEYLIVDERVFRKGWDDEEFVVEALFGYENMMLMTDEEVKTAYENADWEKAIMVNIIP
ncbi:MAG: hypothetical protein IJP58_03005 [Clostridia bacterium]|nr:hypothetical protein [Clostridia bacterium]